MSRFFHSLVACRSFHVHGLALMLLSLSVFSGCAEPAQREQQPLMSDSGYPPKSPNANTNNVKQVAAQGYSNSGTKDEQAPETFQVRFNTTKGEFLIEVHREWSPNGADRFYSLVKNGFYDDCAFFRAVEGFMVQFGIGATPDKNFGWDDIVDDPRPVKSNQRGFVTFAKTGRPNSRTTQVFINFGDNSNLDLQGFTPFGKVIAGMNVVDSINKEYGEAPSQLQGAIKQRGNSVLKDQFPNLDYVNSAEIYTNETVQPAGGAGTP